MKHHSPIAIAAVLALHSLAAQAQTADATLSTVTVNASADASAEGLAKPFAGGQVARGGRVGVLGNLDVMDTPFSTTNYTSELIQDQQAQSIGDVLLNDPSVRQARGFGNFQQTYFIRGFTVFSDDLSYNGLYGLVPRQYMATEFVERVELFRGANAFLSGAGAGSVAGSGIGGLINVMPKRATNDPISRVTVGGQTGGQGYLAADVGRRFGPDQATGVRINLARRDGGTGIDNEKQAMTAASIGLDWHSRNVRLSGDLGFQEHKLTQPRPSVTPTTFIPAAPDASSNYALPWTYSNDRDVFGTVRGEVDLNDSWTTWGAVGARHGKENNSLGGLTMNDAAGNATPNRFDNTRENRVLTGEVGIRGRLTTGSVKHTLVASASALDSRERNAFGYNYGTGLTSNIYGPVNGTIPPLTTIAGTLGSPRETEHIKNSSVALSDTLSILQDSVLLTLGARHQTIDYKTYDAGTGTPGTPYKESRTTPVAGVVFKVLPQVSLYANYIEGLVKGDTVNGTPPYTNQGQALAPYVSKQKEIGAKYDGGNLGASVALFSIAKPNVYAVNNTLGAFGEQRHQGVELSAFGEVTRGLRLLGGVTIMNAEQTRNQGGLNDGNDVVGVPKQQANLGVDWDVPGIRGLALNARAIYTGAQYADAANTLRVPAWTRFDLGVRYTTEWSGRLLTLRARVDNVADKNYWASVGGYPNANYLTQGTPRTFALTATVDF